MKRVHTLIIVYFFLIVISGSCGRKSPNEIQQSAESAVLNESSSEVKTYLRSSSNLVDDLYKELVDKSPALNKIEEDLESLAPKANKVNSGFNEYDLKSKNYYSAANNKAGYITDSLLRNSIKEIIEKSKNQYANNSAGLNALLKQISQNGTSLHDHHEALKIVMTLPVIEKYQKENFPDADNYKELVKEQEKLIEQMDSIISKH